MRLEIKQRIKIRMQVMMTIRTEEFMELSNEYAYIRVSSHEQNEERQLVAMRQLHIPEENIFMDKQSGKDFNRPN